jgi:hypothetical protein
MSFAASWELLLLSFKHTTHLLALNMIYVPWEDISYTLLFPRAQLIQDVS